jgi:hypothetical protein
MLSGPTRNLQFSSGFGKMQIPRFARSDIQREFFNELLG